MMPVEMTPEEFKLLEDPTERKRVMGDSILTITGKLLGPPHRLDNVALKNVHFVDCDFLGHYMFKVNMTNISFTRCAISNVRWEDGMWNDVSFVECVGKGQGNNIIPGAGMGTMTYDKCKFEGDDPPTPQDIDDFEYQGGIGAAGKSKFTNCEFTLMRLRIIGEATLQNCTLKSIRIESARSKVPIEKLLIENCNCTYPLDLSNRGIYDLTIKNGNYHQIDISDVSANNVVLENIVGNVNAVRLKSIDFKAINCIFKAGMNELDTRTRGGLLALYSSFDTGLIENCKFIGERSKLDAPGEAAEFDKHGKLIPKLSGSNEVLPYFTEWGTMTLIGTPILNGDLNYSRIKHLVLQDTSLSNTTIAHSKIGELTLKNVKLSGNLDFSDTQVKTLTSENVTKEGLSLVKDKKTELELTASLTDKLSSGVGKWFS